MGVKHNFEEDEAHELAGQARIETWAPSKRKRDDEEDKQDKRRPAALTDGGSNQGNASQSSRGQGQSSSSQDTVAVLTARAETAEQQMEFLNSIVLRVVESLTRSIAAMQTAALFARSAADAFTSEQHNLQRHLDQTQGLYAGTESSSL